MFSADALDSCSTASELSQVDYFALISCPDVLFTPVERSGLDIAGFAVAEECALLGYGMGPLYLVG